MKLFSRTKKKNNLLKIYKTVTQQQAEQFNTKALIDFVLDELSQLDLAPTHFYITGPYPSRGWQSQKSFLKSIQKRNYRSIHHLLISVGDIVFFNFENWAHNFTFPLDFHTIEYDLMIKDDRATKEWLGEHALRLLRVLDFDYGYIFDQPRNYTINEGKIVSGLFSTTEKENKVYKRWETYQHAIKDGYIRQLYRFNFLSDKAIGKSELTDLIINRQLGAIIKKDKMSLWTLNDDELEVAKQLTKNSDIIVKKGQFDDTESKKDIDDNLWNRIRPTTMHINHASRV